MQATPISETALFAVHRIIAITTPLKPPSDELTTLHTHPSTSHVPTTYETTIRMGWVLL